MTQHRVRAVRSRAAVVVTAIAALAVVAGCTQPTTVAPAPPPASGSVRLGWWAAGDSLFGGHAGVFAAPAYLPDAQIIARSGSTLAPVQLFGAPQPTVRQQIQSAIARFGTPERVIVHAGVADLVARAVWGAMFPLERYAAAIAELDEWLADLGVEVFWSSLVPMASWSTLGSTGQDAVRQQLNDTLRELVGERFIDCEEALTGVGGRWIAPAFVQADGVHVTLAGAFAHANCISDDLVERHGLDLPVVTAEG